VELTMLVLFKTDWPLPYSFLLEKITRGVSMPFRSFRREATCPLLFW